MADYGQDDQGQVTSDEEAQRLLDELEREIEYAPPIDADQAISFALRQPPANTRVNLDVPYIHQMWDTPDSFDGHWACGPTSTTMVLAYYGFLEPKPIQASKPIEHENDYGWYVCNAFSHGDRTFDARAGGPKGSSGQGIYGAIVHEGVAQAIRNVNGLEKGILPVLRHFMKPVGNTVEFVSKPTRRDVINSLEEGHPVIISGNVFGWGHVIVIKGYAYNEATDTFHWIINDPHGYRNAGTHDGLNVAYEWKEIYHPSGEPSKYMFRIRGPYKPG
jgi:uncharacterized protein YvpB